MTVTAIFILGILFGSFINALVWRLHEQRKNQKQLTDAKTPSQDELSILKGRSMCPNCKHTLGAKDLVPVLSWLTLAGRCRYCRKAISWQYPLVELITGTLFAISYVFLPKIFVTSLLPFTFYLLLAIFYLLLTIGMALAVYDAKWYLLPNKLMYPFWAVSGLFVAYAATLEGGMRALAEASLSALAFYALFRLIFEVSRGKWIGYGDVRLAVPIGLLAGSLPKVMLLLFAASFAGTLVSLPFLLHKKKKVQMQIPFGPFLLGATFVVVLWGQKAVDWYISYLG